MRIDPFTLQRLRDLPIEQVAERVGLHVERHKSLCPFHDDHRPSLTFHTRSNTFRCFSCGARGGPIDLVMRRLQLGFPQACQWLMEGEGIAPLLATPPRPLPRQREPHPFDAARYARFFEHPWLSDQARKFLFGQRRLDPRVVAWCRLTSWTDRHGTHWLQTPYYDTHLRLVGLQNRNLDHPASTKQNAGTTAGRLSDPPGTDSLSDAGTDSLSEAGTDSPSDAETDSLPEAGTDSETSCQTSCQAGCQADGQTTSTQPRFRFPQGSRCGLYNQPVLLRLRPGEPLYITEGCSDCWAMLSSGHKAVAIPSATTLHEDEVRLLLDLHDRLSTPFHMYPDADAPGERLFMQLRDLLPGLTHHHLPPGCKDFSDYYLSITKIAKSS